MQPYVLVFNRLIGTDALIYRDGRWSGRTWQDKIAEHVARVRKWHGGNLELIRVEPLR